MERGGGVNLIAFKDRDLQGEGGMGRAGVLGRPESFAVCELFISNALIFRVTLDFGKLCARGGWHGHFASFCGKLALWKVCCA